MSLLGVRVKVFRLTERADDALFDASGRVWNVVPWDGLHRVSCLLLGHVPIPDQCGLAAHDRCAYCGTPMPGAA